MIFHWIVEFVLIINSFVLIHVIREQRKIIKQYQDMFKERKPV